jgi:hypothetical protein
VTVGELIEELNGFKPDLPVEMQIENKWRADVNQVLMDFDGEHITIILDDYKSNRNS